jgi:hypothetical protein
MAFSKNTGPWTLTGEAARRFVAEADKNYQEYLERVKRGVKKTPEQIKYDNWVKESVKNMLT